MGARFLYLVVLCDKIFVLKSLFRKLEWTSVSVGDVVTYDERAANGDTKHVMAAVVAIVSQRTSTNRFNLRLQVRRLYEFHELLRILDSIAAYRQISKLKRARLQSFC